MSRERLWTGTVKTLATPRGGTYRGQVVPLEAERRYGDPLVLWECRHRHRRQARARECARKRVVEVRQEYR